MRWNRSSQLSRFDRSDWHLSSAHQRTVCRTETITETATETSTSTSTSMVTVPTTLISTMMMTVTSVRELSLHSLFLSPVPRCLSLPSYPGASFKAFATKNLWKRD